MNQKLAGKMNSPGIEGTPDYIDKDYTGSDGRLYCGKCRTPKEHRFCFEGKEHIVPVLCSCKADVMKKRMEECRQKERVEEIRRQKSFCIHDKALMSSTFETDDGSLPLLVSARRYVETWKEREANNDGLLLWGDVGTGKTFYAACIANALIESGISVMMTNFAKILNRISGFYSEDRNRFVSELMKYALLILDDFGMERRTEYALEQVYHIVDERYKTRRPLIVTTNLTLNELKNPNCLSLKRINDRLLAMCVPVGFVGENHRMKERTKKYKECKVLFS